MKKILNVRLLSLATIQGFLKIEEKLFLFLKNVLNELHGLIKISI